MRRLSWKRLLIVLAVGALVSGTTYALHQVQVRRQAGVLRERAERAKAAIAADPDRRQEALALYEQYLKFRPQDEDAAIQYFHLVIDPEELDVNRLSRMADVGSKILRDFPDHPAERKQLIKVLYNKGDLNSAKEHLEMLLKDPRSKTDLDVLEEAVRIEETRGRDHYGTALLYAEQGIALGKEQDLARAVKFSAKALSLLREMHRDTEAALKLDALQKPPFADCRDARLVVVRHLIASRDYEQARKQAEFARQLPGGEEDPDVLLANAEVAVVGRDPRLDDARRDLQRAFELDPKRVGVGALLADVLMRQGARDDAIRVLARASESLTEVKEDFYAVLDKLIDLKETVVSERLLERLTPENSRPYVIQYFRGRWELAKGNWPEARANLEACAHHFSGMPQYAKKIRSDLGQCYSLSHNPDQMLESYRAACDADPTYLPAQIGLAEALVKLGRIRDAIPIYRTLVTDLPELRPALARLVLLEQISRPESARDWNAFTVALGPPPYSTELLLLKAEAASWQRNAEASRQALQQAKTQDPNNPAVELKELKLTARNKLSADEAARLIEEAQKATGDTVDFRLAKANILFSRSRPPTVAELKAIANNLPPNFQKGDLYRLWFGLGDIAHRQADPLLKQAALDFFRKAAELEPLDLVVRALMIDLALTLNLPEVWQQCLEEIRKAEGEDGPIYNLGLIAIRLKSTPIVDQAALRDLRERAERIVKKRPSWSRAYLALAQLDELEGLNDSALQNLLKAIEFGERQEAVIRRTVDLLRERKQYQEAAVLLNKLHSEVVLPDDLQRFRAIMNLLTSDVLTQDAREIDSFAPEDAPTYEMQLLRGTLLAAVKDNARAEAAFRKALEKVPSSKPNAAPLEAWVSLVTLLVRTEQLPVARQAVEEAERKLRTTPPKTENLLALANMNETIGQLEAAENYHRQIVALAPGDLDSHRQLVLFLQRAGRASEAETLLRSLLNHPVPGIARWARRWLALTWISQPTAYQNRALALDLVERNLRESKEDKDDRIAYAFVLCVDPARRAEGIRILADYAARIELTPDEYYWLTRIYFDQGRFEEAEETLKFAIRHRPNIVVDHLAGAVWLYLAMNRPRLALETLNRLKAVAPKSWEACREEARYLARAGDIQAARQLVLNFPGAADSEAFIRQQSGPLLDEIKADDDVERLYRKLLDISKDPDRHLPLAAFLISRKRSEEAIELARRRADEAHVVVTARIMSGAIRAKVPDMSKVSTVETWIAQRLKEHQNDPETFAALLSALAEVHDAQGRYDEAIEDYRRSIAIRKTDLAVNNLAMLLALHRPGAAAEARKMMDELIAMRGPEPTFLDTRAVCALVQGEKMTAEAVKDLHLALAMRQRPVYYFHLAWAYDLQREDKKKNEAILKARQFGLTTDDLHPKELPKYAELMRQ